MNVSRPIVLVLVVVLGVALLAALFMAYQHPAMLVDFSSMMFCG